MSFKVLTLSQYLASYQKIISSLIQISIFYNINSRRDDAILSGLKDFLKNTVKKFEGFFVHKQASRKDNRLYIISSLI